MDHRYKIKKYFFGLLKKYYFILFFNSDFLVLYVDILIVANDIGMLHDV